MNYSSTSSANLPTGRLIDDTTTIQLVICSKLKWNSQVAKVSLIVFNFGRNAMNECLFVDDVVVETNS